MLSSPWRPQSVCDVDLITFGAAPQSSSTHSIDLSTIFLLRTYPTYIPRPRYVEAMRRARHMSRPRFSGPLITGTRLSARARSKSEFSSASKLLTPRSRAQGAHMYTRWNPCRSMDVRALRRAGTLLRVAMRAPDGNCFLAIGGGGRTWAHLYRMHLLHDHTWMGETKITVGRATSSKRPSIRRRGPVLESSPGENPLY